MKTMMFGAVALSMLVAPVALPAPALAQWHGDHGRGGPDRGGPDRGWHGDRHDWNPQGSYRYDRRYRDRRLGRNDMVYRGGDGRY
jgi:hypothetical protein